MGQNWDERSSVARWYCPLTMLALAFLVLTQSQAGLRPTFTLCIDPGHPSEVGEGTRGAKVSEIHVAWIVAKRLEKIMLGKHFKVILTKQTENQYVRNTERSKIANGRHADLFLRLHCDSSSGTGFATYYPDRQGTVHGFTGPDPELLKRLAPIAKRFHKALAKDLSGYLKDNGLKSDIQTAVGSKQGALTGSIYSHVPVVLVEMCVLTNPSDERKVSSLAGQDKLAQALADAVVGALSPE